MSYASVARGEAFKRLRVPAWAAKGGLPSVVPTLPLNLGAVPPLDPEQFYGIRLRDSFGDALSLWNGERGYVRDALCRFGFATVIPTGARDPLLLLARALPAPTSGREALPRIRFLQAPASPDPLPSLPSERFFAVQSFGGGSLEQNAATKDATPMPFKSFCVLSVPASSGKKAEDELKTLVARGVVAAMPREFLTESGAAAHVLQGRPSQGVSPDKLARELAAKGASFVFVQGKGAARAYFDSGFVSKDAFAKLCADVPSLESAFSEDWRFEWRRPKEQVAIRRVDGNPVTEEVAEILAQTLALTKPKVQNGALIGATPRAKELHDTVFGRKFSIRWLGADAAEEENAKKQQETDANEEGEAEEGQGCEGERWADEGPPAQA